MSGARSDGRPPENGLNAKRMKGLEPSTFCMARTVRERSPTVTGRQTALQCGCLPPQSDSG